MPFVSYITLLGELVELGLIGFGIDWVLYNSTGGSAPPCGHIDIKAQYPPLSFSLYVASHHLSLALSTRWHLRDAASSFWQETLHSDVMIRLAQCLLSFYHSIFLDSTYWCYTLPCLLHPQLNEIYNLPNENLPPDKAYSWRLY